MPDFIAERATEQDRAEPKRDPVTDTAAREPGVKTARIVVTIVLDAAAWEWERFGERGTGEEWDASPRAILDDVVEYCSGWRLPGGSIPGSVEYKGQLIEIDGLTAIGITTDFDYSREEE